jgi:protein TonB
LAASLLLHTIVTALPIHWNTPETDREVVRHTTIVRRIALATPTPPPHAVRAQRQPKPMHVNVVRVHTVSEARPQEVRPPVTAVREAPPVPVTAATGAVGEAPATAAPAATAPPRALKAWQGQIVAKLERLKQYPESAREAGEQGVVYVRFRLDRSGNVISVSLTTSSGYDDLDDEVLALVERASPFPAPPSGVSDAKLEMVVPVTFDLSEGS